MVFPARMDRTRHADPGGEGPSPVITRPSDRAGRLQRYAGSTIGDGPEMPPVPRSGLKARAFQHVRPSILDVAGKVINPVVVERSGDSLVSISSYHNLIDENISSKC